MVWKPFVAGVAFLVLVFGVHAITRVGFFDSAVVLVASLAGVWWIAARRRAPRLLERVSIAALAMAVLARLLEGPRWQLVMWQLVAVLVASFAALRMWRPDRSIKLTRILSRLALVVTMLIGAAALSVEPAPALPAPSGDFHVGSQTFHWSDPSRPEALSEDSTDSREVVAQVWYPSDGAGGSTTPYIGTSVPASLMDGVPKVVFEDYDGIDTHASDETPVSTDRAKWPVLLFSPGLSMARQSYTALSTELASRGYVVVTLSHPYDSPATQLIDGDVVTANDASSKGERGDPFDLRAGDASFVLNQLHELAEKEPESPLVGHLDLARVGIIGHSFGGATAVRAIANDHRFVAGLNIDGNVFGEVPSLDKPFLWVQAPHASAPLGQNELMDQLTADGAVVTVDVDGEVHMSFSDYPSYLTPVGRETFGRVPMIGWGAATTAEITPVTSDVVTAFFGPILGGSDNGDLNDVARRYASVTLERTVESR